MKITQVRSFIDPVLFNNTQAKSSNLQNNRQLQNDIFVKNNMSASSPISFSGNYWAVAYAIERGQTIDIDKDIDPNMIGYVYNLLMSSAVYGNSEMAEKLLARKDIDVNAKIGNGNTALLLALKYKQPIIAGKILAHKDIDVNAADNCGLTALMRAVDNGNADVVEKLLSRKDVDVNAKSDKGKTALMLAIENGYDDIAESIQKYIETMQKFQT